MIYSQLLYVSLKYSPFTSITELKTGTCVGLVIRFTLYIPLMRMYSTHRHSPTQPNSPPTHRNGRPFGSRMGDYALVLKLDVHLRKRIREALKGLIDEEQGINPMPQCWYRNQTTRIGKG